jgi:hypothetical protein
MVTPILSFPMTDLASVTTVAIYISAVKQRNKKPKYPKLK